MAEKATILIPDISGFTSFSTVTEIDHAAHIISELLDLIIASNDMGFTLAEIEGDAVLFYLKGEAPDPSHLVRQCVRMFDMFHTRIMVIERDTICQCGACQTATNLSLKFIAHFGEIKEIRVANFVKATGVDMIIAHRLLKNEIPSDEYILLTKPCVADRSTSLPSDHFSWTTANQVYQAIGEVEFEYAILSGYKEKIPRPEKPREFVFAKGADNLEVEINKPVFDVYQALINVDERKNWMIGVDQINRDPVTERIGMQHNCQFMGMTMVNTCLQAEYTELGASYVEQVEMEALSLDTVDYYTLTPLREKATLLNFNINWKMTPLADDIKQGMLQGIKANLESLKVYIENKPDE